MSVLIETHFLQDGIMPLASFFFLCVIILFQISLTLPRSHTLGLSATHLPFCLRCRLDTVRRHLHPTPTSALSGEWGLDYCLFAGFSAA